MHITKLRALALLAIAIEICGCGGTGANLKVPPSTATLPSIVTQPTNESVPMGLTATFSVAADFSPSADYQWSENGTPIAGATGRTYTTPTLTWADTGSIFTVSVSNSAGSVTSNAATLTVTARAPEAGDLRFQQVAAASTVNGYSLDGGIVSTDLGNDGFYTFQNATGTPLFIGNNCCLWQFLPWALPTGITGLNAGYLRDQFDYFQADLNGTGYLAFAIGDLSTPNTVITSLSLVPTNDLFALSWIQTSQPGGFDMAQHTVALGDFQAAATQEGQESRVITAVSYDAGQVFYLSYGWTGDTTTVYETQIAATTVDTVTSVVTNLAAEGYIITAIGGQEASDGSGVLVVGTRVQGDTMPRPILVMPVAGDINQIFEQGYALIAVVNSFAANGNGQLVFKNYIGER